MEYITSLLETLYMVSISSIIAYILGFPIGVLSVLTEKGGLLENKYISFPTAATEPIRAKIKWDIS